MRRGGGGGVNIGSVVLNIQDGRSLLPSSPHFSVNLAKSVHASVIYSLSSLWLRQGDRERPVKPSNPPPQYANYSVSQYTRGNCIKGWLARARQTFLSSGSCELNAPSPTGRMMDDSHMGEFVVAGDLFLLRFSWWLISIKIYIFLLHISL
jgi:hypothetical protein